MQELAQNLDMEEQSLYRFWSAAWPRNIKAALALQLMDTLLTRLGVSICSLTFWPLIVKMTYCRLSIPSVSYVELTTPRDLGVGAFLEAAVFFEGAWVPLLHLLSLCPLFRQMFQMWYLNGQLRAKCKSPHSQQGDGGFPFWDCLGIFFLCGNSSILRTLPYSSVLFWR